jgi:hypothetical protein
MQRFFPHLYAVLLLSFPAMAVAQTPPAAPLMSDMPPHGRNFPMQTLGFLG